MSDKNFVINDVHAHITLEPTIYGESFDFVKFLNDSYDVVDNSIVFINPTIKSLYNFGFVTTNSTDGGVEYFANGNLIYSGTDPFRNLNEKLILLSEPSDNLFPFIYLTPYDNSITSELEYFEKNYKGKFFGISVHPNLTSTKMSSLKFDSNYPIIIHSGVGEFDDPADILEFAKHYSGNVIIAHFARFNYDVLSEIGKMKNVFIDTSPTYLPYQVIDECAEKIYKSKLSASTNEITNLFKDLIELVGEDKIIFGTDVPWGDYKHIKLLYNELKLPMETKEKIFAKNFFKIFGCQEKSQIKAGSHFKPANKILE